MIQLPNISPLPFYKSLDELYSKQPLAYGVEFPLITKTGSLTPFQINIDAIKNDYRISAITVSYGKTNVIKANIYQSMLNTGLSIKTIGNDTYIIYKATGPIPELDEDGIFYMTIYLEKPNPSGPSIKMIIYSDMFCQKSDMSNCITITYRNSENFTMNNKSIIFDDGFAFIIHVNSMIGRPEYVLEEEGVKRGGVFYREFQMSKKRYHFGFPATEYLCDAIRIIPMCDNVKIERGDKDYSPIQIQQDVDWLEQGNIASVSVEFDTDNIITSSSGVVTNL